MTIFAEHYDFVISLLLLENGNRWMALDPEREEDAYDRLAARS